MLIPRKATRHVPEYFLYVKRGFVFDPSCLTFETRRLALHVLSCGYQLNVLSKDGSRHCEERWLVKIVTEDSGLPCATVTTASRDKDPVDGVLVLWW
jgi:hypothetical protein